MKKAIISFSAAWVFIVILTFITNYKNPQDSVPHIGVPQVRTVTGPVTVQPVSFTIKQDSYLLSISANYPSFPQASNQFNTTIKNDIEDSVSEFIKTATRDYEVRLSTEGDTFLKEFEGPGMYTYVVRYEVIQSNNQFISVVVHSEAYSGGAHGYHIVSTYNYDVIKDKILELTDVYPVAGGLKAIAELSRAELEKKFKADGVYDDQFLDMMREGTDPAEAFNFARFSFDGKNVYVHFAEYQVAPYVYGSPKITLPALNN